ncbi:unnamed protein product [Malus baccata var. baccata]
MLPSNYLENWNFMKFVNETNQTYFEVSSASPTEFIYSYQYKITIFTNGVELKYLKTPYLLRLIDLSSIIGKLRGLHFLNLSNNTLNGLIPSSVGNLTALELLELSENQLSKSISSNWRNTISLRISTSTPPPPSVFEEDEDPEIPFRVDWYVVLPGVFYGLIVGIVAGNAFADRRHEWFAETFSKRRRQPRAKGRGVS